MSVILYFLHGKDGVKTLSDEKMADALTKEWGTTIRYTYVAKARRFIEQKYGFCPRKRAMENVWKKREEEMEHVWKQ